MKISIYGAGWLGNPLAIALSGYAHEIWATRSKNTHSFGIPSLHYLPWRAELGMNKNLWKPLIDSELQIWCIPPRVKINGDFFYTEIIQEWLEYLKGSPVQKIIFLSSTSVYLPIDGIINEESEVHMDSIIFKAEQLIEQSKIPHLILRLGGLMGADRYVGKYYSGKQVDRANGPVNYIHLDDAVQFTLSAINCDLVGIFNLVAPEHPLRKDVVEQSCLKHQLPLPTGYLYNEIAPKIISSEKITNTLDLAFIHPNPIDF